MSTSRLPIGHPLTKLNLASLSPFDVADQIVAYRHGWSGGLQMKDPADDPDPDDDDPDDDEEEDDDLADPESTVKVGERTFKVGDLQRIMAREKRQGKKSGAAALAKELGFDSVEGLKTAVAKVTDDDDDDDPDDESDKKAAKRARADADRRAAERERKAAERERRADLRSALAVAGVPKDDLDDAYALLDRQVDGDYDDDELDDAVEELRGRRPALFGTLDEDDDDTTKNTKVRRPPPLPSGGRRKKATQQTVFGAGGLAMAEKRFGKKK